MIDTKKNVLIGQVYREHGVKGFCKCHVYDEFIESLIEDETYHLENIQGDVCKVKLQNVSTINRYFLLKFDKFDSPESLLDWRKSKMYLPKNKLQKEKNQTFDFEWEGYTVFSTDKVQIGTVQKIVHNPLKQIEVLLSNQNKTILIPFVEAWIQKNDTDKKQLIVNIPEGILDL